jgi:hypothetical protein
MSLISGSYSRLAETGGATPLLRADMVEKDAAEAVRDESGDEAAVRRAIGVAVLQEKAVLWRRERDAELHRLRLKADILRLASACAVATSMRLRD